MERLRVGDNVVVISGKNKKKQGRLLRINRQEGTVIVEGVNIVVIHKKPIRKDEKGQLVRKEAPLSESKVMPVDPETGKRTRVRVQLVEGKRVRVAKSGAPLIAS